MIGNFEPSKRDLGVLSAPVDDSGHPPAPSRDGVPADFSIHPPHAVAHKLDPAGAAFAGFAPSVLASK